MSEFPKFKKIPRLSREIVITEKIDGTNGLIYIDENNNIFAGSRNRWLDDHSDNHGFWHWVMENKEELLNLGKGYHYGEWWGSGIQRGYGLVKGEKRFSLFNTGRWVDSRLMPDLKDTDKRTHCPECCYVVPILYEGMFDTIRIDSTLEALRINGSFVMSGFMKPEGIVIFHKAGNLMFKKTIEKDESPKNTKESQNE